MTVCSVQHQYDVTLYSVYHQYNWWPSTLCTISTTCDPLLCVPSVRLVTLYSVQHQYDRSDLCISRFQYLQLLQECTSSRLKSRMCWLLVEWQMPAVDRSYDRYLLTDLHKDPFSHMEPRYAYLLVINTWGTPVCVVISSPYIPHVGYIHHIGPPAM